MQYCIKLQMAAETATVLDDAACTILQVLAHMVGRVARYHLFLAVGHLLSYAKYLLPCTEKV